MSSGQEIVDLVAPLEAETSGDELRLSLPEGQPERFLLLTVPSLTRRTAQDIVDRPHDGPPRRLFVSFDRSSPDGREALRRAGVSFAGEDGHVFVRAPGILVEREGSTRAPSREAWEFGGENETRNPFARRSSRVPRWLLLHPEESVSPTALARAVELNPAAVSRTLRALLDAACLEPEVAPLRRRRALHLARPRALVEAWLPLW